MDIVWLSQEQLLFHWSPLLTYILDMLVDAYLETNENEDHVVK